MEATITHYPHDCSPRRRVLALLAALVVMGSVCQAAPPLEPLPAPLFSFDSGSPGTYDGIDPGDILSLDGEGPGPLINREDLGLMSPDDDLDGLSAGNFGFPSQATFMLMFSVSRATVGAVPPHSFLVLQKVPYNVMDQAARGHAAGDQFMSTQLFSRSGVSGGGDPANNSLSRNNYNEGGTSFGAMPETHAFDHVNGSEQDGVNAFARLSIEAEGGAINVYFTVSSDSPSLASLPGYLRPSGAHVFFNAAPGATPTTLYAQYSQLGLVQGDDIDALIVFDLNEDGLFNLSDQVIFSLAPGSPSLYTILGASLVGPAADVYTVSPGLSPSLFAAALDLGLGAASDNLTALDTTYCASPLDCATTFGIRTLAGDTNCDDFVDFDDIDAFVLALTGQPAYEAAYPYCHWLNGDCDGDGDVDFDDIDVFVDILSGV